MSLIYQNVLIIDFDTYMVTLTILLINRAYLFCVTLVEREFALNKTSVNIYIYSSEKLVFFFLLKEDVLHESHPGSLLRIQKVVTNYL